MHGSKIASLIKGIEVGINKIDFMPEGKYDRNAHFWSDPELGGRFGEKMDVPWEHHEHGCEPYYTQYILTPYHESYCRRYEDLASVENSKRHDETLAEHCGSGIGLGTGYICLVREVWYYDPNLETDDYEWTLEKVTVWPFSLEY
jgi:hypothetical protein